MLELSPDLDEFDLDGILFVLFENWRSFDESREILEYEIMEAWDAERMAEGVSEMDATFPNISSYWVFRVEQRRAAEKLEKLPPDQLAEYDQKCLAAIAKHRAEHAKDIAAGKAPPFPQLPPVPRPKRARQNQTQRTPKPAQ